MITHLLEVRVPAPVAAPQGARAAAAAALWLSAAARAVWRSAQAMGERRASAHLRRLAWERQATNPEMAGHLRETARWLAANPKTEDKA